MTQAQDIAVAVTVIIAREHVDNKPWTTDFKEYIGSLCSLLSKRLLICESD